MEDIEQENVESVNIEQDNVDEENVEQSFLCLDNKSIQLIYCQRNEKNLYTSMGAKDID